MDIINFLFQDIFPTLIGFSRKIFRFFGSSIGDLIYNAFDIQLPDWRVFDLTLFSLMFGAGLSLFIGYTLAKWFLNLIS